MALQVGLDHLQEWVYAYPHLILFILTFNNFVLVTKLVKHYLPL